MIHIPRNDPGDSEIRSLIVAAKRGEQPSLGELLSHYFDFLMTLATIHFQPQLRPRTSPADVVQESLLRAIIHFGQFQGTNEPQLKAWLRKILSNVLATFIEYHVLAARRDRRREVSIQRFELNTEHTRKRLTDMLPSAGASPEMALQRSEDCLLLAKRLSQLTDDYRQVLVLRNFQELPFEEIAKSLNRSVGATRMLWTRAIEKLRSVYETEEP